MLVRRDGERGFALLEILVAFAVLALGLGAISTGIVVAIRSDQRTQINRTALRMAQSRLEAAGISESLAPGYREGQISQKFRWRRTITEVRPANDRRSPQDAEPTAVNGALGSFWVEVRVEGPDGAAAKLAALKLGPKAKR